MNFWWFWFEDFGWLWCGCFCGILLIWVLYCWIVIDVLCVVGEGCLGMVFMGGWFWCFGWLLLCLLFWGGCWVWLFGVCFCVFFWWGGCIGMLIVGGNVEIWDDWVWSVVFFCCWFDLFCGWFVLWRVRVWCCVFVVLVWGLCKVFFFWLLFWGCDFWEWCWFVKWVFYFV